MDDLEKSICAEVLLTMNHGWTSYPVFDKKNYTCTICYEKLTNKYVLETNCVGNNNGHYFCRDCILPYLYKYGYKICPTCDKQIT